LHCGFVDNICSGWRLQLHQIEFLGSGSGKLSVRCALIAGVTCLGDLDSWVHHSPHKNWNLVLLILHNKDEGTVNDNVEAVIDGGGE